MNVSFDRSFSKALTKINDKNTLKRIERIILQCEAATNVTQISNLKKLVGFKSFYRIKAGDYRIGIEMNGDDIHFITVCHRKDIYDIFP